MAIETLDLIKRLGLNQYESKTYLALATHGPLTAGKLSEIARIPRPRVYDVLSKLEKDGFVLIQPGRPVKYQARTIEEAVKNLKEKKSQELNSYLTEVEEISSIIKTTLKTETQDEQPALTWALKGRSNVYSKLQELIMNAQSEVTISTTPEGLKRKKKTVLPLLKSARKRGVKVNVITHNSDADPETLNAFTQHASKVMHSTQPYRFYLIDDEHSILLLTSEDESKPQEELAVWLKSKEFTQNFKRSHA